MVGRLLIRGMLAGILAACLAVGFAEVVGEPQIARAIAFEHVRDAASGATPDPVLVGRAVQSGVGLLTAGVMYGAGYGGLFALVFAFALGRVGAAGPRTLAALLAAAGLLAVVLVPGLKYPPSPPAVGEMETIGVRTAAYFAMVAVSIATLACAVSMWRTLVSRWSRWDAAVASGLLFVAVVATVQRVFPEFDEVPAHFPAIVLWRFRVAAFGMQVVLWSALGVLFGVFAERLLVRDRRAGTRVPRAAWQPS